MPKFLSDGHFSGASTDLTIDGHLNVGSNSAGSGGKLVIYGEDEQTGFEQYIAGGGQTTVPQFKLGRTANEYLGIYVEDRNAHIIHRQDETDAGMMTMRFDMWDSGTGTHQWQWRSNDGSGGGSSTAMALKKGGLLELEGNLNINNGSSAFAAAFYERTNTNYLLDPAGGSNIATLTSTGITVSKSSTHTAQGSFSANDSHLDLYNSLEANTDQKGSILTFTDNYYDGSNYHKTTRAGIKGGTDTTGNTADGYLEFYTDSSGANSPTLAMRIASNQTVSFKHDVNLDDNNMLLWGGNSIVQHTGSATYIGDNTSGSTLTISGGNSSFAGHVKLASSKYLEYLGSGKLINMDIAGWTVGQQEHNILYAGWTSSTGDYLSFKVPGNSTVDHGNLIIGDTGLWFGRMDATDSAAATDSNTNPNGDSNYFRVNTAGDLQVSGSITSPVFYDTAGTTYYLDLGNSSNSLTIPGIISMADNKGVTWPGGSIRAEGSTLKLVAGSLIQLQDATQIHYDGGDGAIGLDIHNSGTATGDDVKITFETQGQYDYIMGIDRSDSLFKISRSAAFGTNDVISLDSNSNTTFAGNITANTGTSHSFLTGNTHNLSTADTTGFRLHQTSYTDGRYTHRFRKKDMSGGVPLYLDFSSGTANVFANLMRFGKYTGESIDVEVNGKLKATHFYGDGSNLTNLPSGSSTTINNNANNRVITGSGTANTLEAESGLTFDGDILELVASGTTTKRLKVSPSTDYGRAHIGRAALGKTAYDDHAGFAHEDYNSNTGYALLQNSGGNTFVNATTDGTGYLRIGNTTRAYWNSNSFYAPTFTDSDNTAYYLNPAGTSVVNHMDMDTGNTSGKFAVKSSAVHGSYDFYNNGTSYFNGDVVINAALQVQDYIYHEADTNTHIFFGPDRQVYTAGGTTMLQINKNYYGSRYTGLETGIGLHSENLGGANLIKKGTDIAVATGYREEITGPDGSRKVQAHVSTGSGVSGQCYHWYSSENVVVNPEKDYEISVWVKSTGTHNLYLGWHEYKSDGTQISSNPYFHTSTINTSSVRNVNGWVLLKYQLKSHRTTSGQSDSEGSDRYATNGNSSNFQPSGSTGVMHSTTKLVHIRMGTCYGSGTDKSYFWNPKITEAQNEEFQWNTSAARVFATEKVQSPLFSDNNNTNYYIDPSSTGTSINLNGGGTFQGAVTIDSDGSTDNYYLNFNEAGSARFTIYENSNNVYFNGWAGHTIFRPQMAGSGSFAVTQGNTQFDTSGNARFAGKLKVQGDAPVTPNTNFDDLVITDSAHAGMSIFSGGTDKHGAIYFGDPDANNRGQIKYLHNNDSMTFATAAGSASLTLSSGSDATFAGNIEISGSHAIKNNSNGHLSIETASGKQMFIDSASSLRFDSGGAKALTLDTSQKATFEGSVVAPLFYDTDTNYYLNANGTGVSLNVAGKVKAAGGFTIDDNNKFYSWRALENTGASSNQYHKIARITAGQSSRFIIELVGRSSSYGDTALPAFGKIVGQLNNDNNYDIVYYNASATDEVVDEVGQVDVSTTATDIYVRCGQFSELSATAHISDGTIDPTSATEGNGSVSAPTNYVQATEYKLWNTGNDGSGSGLDADTLDGLHASSFLTSLPSHNHDDRYYTETEVTNYLSGKTNLNDIRSLGTIASTGGSSTTISTADFIAEIESDGAFDSYSSVFKNSWSYAGNKDLSDAGRFTETAGASFLTWTDNSDDSVRGNITALVIAPNTGGSANKAFIYNDQGSSYAPGWREIWTSASDGAGSGLDADKLDGQEGSHYLAYGNLTGVPSSFTPSQHTQAFSTITSTPTTLAGYGITDASALKSGTVSSVNNSGFKTAFRVENGGLASHIVVSVQGTTGNVVVSNIIHINVNHSQDIMIEGLNGVYTLLTVKVISDNNENFAVEFKTNSSNAVTLYLEVHAYGNEVITFTNMHAYTGNSVEATLNPGKTVQGSGGNNGDIRTAGTFYGGGSGLTSLPSNQGNYLVNDADDTMNGSLTIDDGTSSTLWVKCDDGGNAVVRASGEGQGTGVLEVGQSTTYGGGISYNGDNSPSFVSGETADNITFYRMDNGTRTEVFHYPYNSSTVNFNVVPTFAGTTAPQQNFDNTGELRAINFKALAGGHSYFYTSAGNLRGYITAQDVDDAHLCISTSGGEDIAFKDGGTSGTTNMLIRGDGNVIVTGNTYSDAFYDDHATNYYLNPGSTSTSLNVAGHIYAAGVIQSTTTVLGNTIICLNGSGSGIHLRQPGSTNVIAKLDGNTESTLEINHIKGLKLNTTNSQVLGYNTTNYGNTYGYLGVDVNGKVGVVEKEITFSIENTGWVGRHSNPVKLLDEPGADKMIVVQEINILINYTAPIGIGSSGICRTSDNTAYAVGFYQGSGTNGNFTVTGVMPRATMQFTTTTNDRIVNRDVPVEGTKLYPNKALYWKTTRDAANNSSSYPGAQHIVKVRYRIVDVSTEFTGAYASAQNINSSSITSISQAY